MTAAGKRLSITPNHPVLAPAGWKAAGLLNVGDYVVCCDFGERASWTLATGNHQDPPITIKEVADAFGRSGHMIFAPVVGSAEDFHGDGRAGQITVIRADSHLLYGSHPASYKHIPESDFIPPNGCNGQTVLPTQRPVTQLTDGGFAPEVAKMGSRDLTASLCTAHVRPLQQLGLTPSANRDTGLDEPQRQSGSAAPEIISQLLERFSGSVLLDKITDIKIESIHDFVYNLETESGFYSANGIIIHNCRCSLGLKFETGTVAVEEAPKPAPKVRTAADVRDALFKLRAKTTDKLAGLKAAAEQSSKVRMAELEQIALDASGDPDGFVWKQVMDELTDIVSKRTAAWDKVKLFQDKITKLERRELLKGSGSVDINVVLSSDMKSILGNIPGATKKLEREVSFVEKICEPILKGEDRAVGIGKPTAMGSRSYYSGGNVHWYALDDRDAVIVHEMGHWVEDGFYGSKVHYTQTVDKVRAFLNVRCGSDPEVPLKKYYGWAESWEKTRPDNFRNPVTGMLEPYVGHTYKDAASEVISMGLEWLYTHPAEFAKTDPEYFDFIYSLVRGLPNGY